MVLVFIAVAYYLFYLYISWFNHIALYFFCTHAVWHYDKYNDVYTISSYTVWYSCIPCILNKMNTNGYYNEISTIIFLPVYAVNQIDRCKEPKGNKKRFITYNSPSWQCTTLHSLWSILPYVECCVQHYIPHIVTAKIWKMCNLGKYTTITS